MDLKDIIINVELTEKDLFLLDKYNKIVLIVNRNSTKKDIKNAVEKLFNVKVRKVNTLITSEGKKKAYITIDKNYKAQDILSKMGLM
ncbi:MAG: 50S ribosomal protein L23 [Nanopusillaceae archaeon]|jgi:large subunit ribosomal protein L23